MIIFSDIFHFPTFSILTICLFLYPTIIIPVLHITPAQNCTPIQCVLSFQCFLGVLLTVVVLLCVVQTWPQTAPLWRPR